MKKLIVIKDLDNKGQLNVSLSQLLNCLDSVGNNYRWSILEFEALGNFDNNFNYQTINEAIEKTTGGFKLSWGQLKQLAEKCNQVVNLVLVADIKIENFTAKESYQTIIKKYPLVISIEDGDYWEIYTANSILVHFH